MKKTSLSCIVLLVACLLVVEVRPALAADYYVDGPGGDGLAEGGSDTNPGTKDAPWRTINHGAQQLKPGDTLYIRGGKYAEALDNTIPGGKSESKRVTVSNYQGEAVILEPKRDEGFNHVILLRGADRSYITLSGLIIEGSAVILHPVRFVKLDADVGNLHHIRFENSTVKNGKKSGILTGADHSEFINLKIEKNGRSRLSHGIYLGGDNNLIQGCEVSYSSGYGLHVYGQTPPTGGVDNNVIRDNYLHHNKAAGAIVGTGTGNHAYNNICANNGAGFAVRGVDTKVYNNTLYGNSVGMNLGRTTNAEIRNNLVYQSGGIDIGSGNTGYVLSNNLVGVDPLFVDATAGDFHLRAGSPAIGHGTALKEVPVDRDGVARPQGANYDAGAYEATKDVDKARPPAGKVLYREVFPNNTGDYLSPPKTAGWKLNYGSKGAAYSLTTSGTSARFVVHHGGGVPADVVPLNSTPDTAYYTYTDDRATGYLYQASTAATGNRLFWTDEYGVDRAEVVEVEWTQNNSGGLSCRVALRVSKGEADTWYVSEDAFNRNSWQTNRLVLAKAAGWHVLNFTAGKRLGIGDAAALPADGRITAFGLYSDKTGTNYSRFDSYTFRGPPPAAGIEAEPPSNDVPPVPPEVKKAKAEAEAAKRAAAAAAREAAEKAAAEAIAAHVPVTYVVAPDGDNANPGTEEKPWKSLQKAAASVWSWATCRRRSRSTSRARCGRRAVPLTSGRTNSRQRKAIRQRT